MSNSARTEAEMKVALDKLNDVIAELGSKEVISSTISGGDIDAPLSSMVSVISEGLTVPDVLETIGVTNITQGRIVILKNNDSTSTETTGAYITVQHATGAGQIEMLDGEDFVLCSKRCIALIYTGNRWVEVWRAYGRNTTAEKLAERTDMGHGTASVETIATSLATTGGGVLKVGASDLAENDVLKVDASGNIVVATGADFGDVDATTLDAIDSTGFVRSDAASAQSIDANLTLTSAGDTNLIITDTSGSQSPGVSITNNGTERGSLFVDNTDGMVELRSRASGGDYTESIRLNPSNSRLEFSTAPGTDAYVSLTPGAGNGLDADTLDGNEWADIPLAVLPTIRTLVFATVDFNNFGTDDGTNREAVPQFTDIEYPVAPNGTRRFLITSHVRYQTQDNQDSNRNINMIWYSSTTPGSVSAGHEIDRQNGPNNTSGNGWTTGTNIAELGLSHRIHTPESGHKFTLAMEEESDDNQSDLLADSGTGPLFGRSYNENANLYGSSRTYVLIEYLDEG
jgi:hypothetical protein